MSLHLKWYLESRHQFHLKVNKADLQNKQCQLLATLSRKTHWLIWKMLLGKFVFKSLHSCVWTRPSLTLRRQANVPTLTQGLLGWGCTLEPVHSLSPLWEQRQIFFVQIWSSRCNPNTIFSRHWRNLTWGTPCLQGVIVWNSYGWNTDIPRHCYHVVFRQSNLDGGIWLPTCDFCKH
jgi:hypothetical protein